MTIALGIDTGGTYTDAVLVDHSSGQVLAGAKALTTYQDLAIGIGEAMAAVLASQAAQDRQITADDVGLVALSTTLATNAIVEGRGSRVCLLLIGYDPDLIRKYGFENDLATQDVVYLRGGHDGAGDEAEPLDEAAARAAILEYRNRVESFAVSGYFSVRNPEHELRVRALIEELTAGDKQTGASDDFKGLPLPVTCGHELTTRLNAVRRATTTALNASLIPLLRDLIATVKRSLAQKGISAPLMVVKGDGSLVRAEWAMQRPIETILAGPAASVVGAWHLAGRQDVWVVDIGGTTTDIATLRNGRPRLNSEGARVGQWRTMVEAVDVHTAGLGGDSQVHLNGATATFATGLFGSQDETGPSGLARLAVGPRRVVPLCILASEYPSVLSELKRQAGRPDVRAGQFVLAQRLVAPGLSQEEQELLDQLANGPQSVAALLKKHGMLAAWRLEALEGRRLLLRAGFTPTDALHALGRFTRWNAEASQLGAEFLAQQLGVSAQELCEHVLAEVSGRVATELVTKVLSDETDVPNWARESGGAALLARALGRAPGSDLRCQLTLGQPVVAIGAPVSAYMPRAAEQLHTELVIPAHAEVANAVGAVAGGVVQELRVLVLPLDTGERFRLHLPGGIQDFATPEDAVAHAMQVVPPLAEDMARRAGATQVELQIARVDRTAPIGAGYGQEVYLETELTFTAVGRPSLAVAVNRNS